MYNSHQFLQYDTINHEGDRILSYHMVVLYGKYKLLKNVILNKKKYSVDKILNYI